MSSLVSIKITINTDIMVKFFQFDPSYGTRNRPYKADNFCTVNAVGAKASGIHNVFEFEKDTEYQFQLIDETSDPEYEIVHDTAAFVLSIIQLNTPNIKDWGKIMNLEFNNPGIDVIGNLIYTLDNEQGKYLFKMKTQSGDQFEQSNNLQYSIIFQVNVNGKIMIAQIDPLIANTSDDHS
jgi:hypothetical protein